MRNQKSKALTSLIAVLMLLSSIALAQGRPRLKADIPFDFSVGGKQMSAGEYVVQRAGSMNHVLQVQSTDLKSVSFVNVIGAVGPRYADKSKLVFRRYGNQYFLAQIWTAGEQEGVQLPRSSAERRVIKKLADHNIARKDVSPEIVTVYAD